MTAKEWNKSRNTFRKVYRNMKAAHPDWSNAKLYMVTKGQLNQNHPLNGWFAKAL